MLKPAAALVAPLIAALALSLGMLPARAADLGAIRAHLGEEGAVAKSIQASPAAGLLEVTLNDNTIVYASEDGRYFIMGDMIDAVGKRALTRERIAQLASDDFPGLPHDLALHFGERGAARKLFVIADPNCPYCARYFEKLEKLQGVEVDVLMVAILGDRSQKSALSIFCAGDVTAAYVEAAHGKEPANAECESGRERLASIRQWLAKHPVKSTPTTLFGDGATVAGDLSAEQLMKHLQG